ncbi:MAG: hypothetical protein ACLVB1_12435 [Blautia obeum]
MPMMRPLFWVFRMKCYRDQNLTFMFGPSVLVANVVEKARLQGRFICQKERHGMI